MIRLIDGSNAYGSSFEESVELRTLRGGRMRVTTVQGKQIDRMIDCFDRLVDG